MYVFCYGMLLNPVAWKEYCAIPLEPNFLFSVTLSGYKLVFDGQSKKGLGAAANIVQEAGGEVRGGLFRINRRDFKVLDLYEGYPQNCQRKEVVVMDVRRKFHKAWVYFRTGLSPEVPGAEYLQKVIDGAKQCQLPGWYIGRLQDTQTLS